jgi:hypothetical protein
MKRLLLLFLLLWLPTPGNCAGNPWIATLYFENDLFTGTDSDYTNGVKYSVISPDLSPDAPQRKTMQIPRKALDIIQRLPLIKNAPQETAHRAELAFGQNIYTPRDTSRFDLIEDDRPYAGYSYVSTAFHRKSDIGRLRSQMDTLEVQFGWVGPSSLGEQAQKFVHRVRGLQRPNGWDHQLKDEPALNLIFERKWLFHPPYRGRFITDLILHAGGALGNVMTYANAGLEVRSGWKVPRSFGVSLIRPAGSTWHNENSGLSLYLFGAVNGRAVARDIFLDGNSFRDSHSVDKKNWVADFSTGVTCSYQRLTFSIAHNIRTREFDQQPDHHSFGSLVLSYAF